MIRPWPAPSTVDRDSWWRIAIKLDLEDVGLLHEVDEVYDLSAVDRRPLAPTLRHAQWQQRFYVYVRDRGRCIYCDCGLDPRNWDADHVVPWPDGPTTTAN